MAAMKVDTNQLTPEQAKDWEYFVKWYREHGWTGDEIEELAWKDLSRKYPDLSSSQGGY